MDPSHLDELIQLEDGYWWHVAKRRLVLTLLNEHFPPPAHVVEGGVGSARNLLAFQERGYTVAGFDIMKESVEHARQRGLADVHVHDLTQPWPLPTESVDAVVLLDVIEHVADPTAVLRHAAAGLRVGGGMVVTVPAYPWLYGDWDRRLGHHRRYTARMFRDHADGAGLDVAWLQHWNAFSLPPALAVRGYQRCFPSERAADFPRVSSLMNHTLLKMAGMERWCLTRRLPVPFGLSLVGVLKK